MKKTRRRFVYVDPQIQKFQVSLKRQSFFTVRQLTPPYWFCSKNRACPPTFLRFLGNATTCGCKSRTIPSLNRHKVPPSRSSGHAAPPRGSCSQRRLSPAKFRARISLTVKYRTVRANLGFGRDGNLTLPRRQINIGIYVSRYQLAPRRARNSGRSASLSPENLHFICRAAIRRPTYEARRRRKCDVFFLKSSLFHESPRQF